MKEIKTKKRTRQRRQIMKELAGCRKDITKDENIMKQRRKKENRGY